MTTFISIIAKRFDRLARNKQHRILQDRCSIKDIKAMTPGSYFGEIEIMEDTLRGITAIT